MWNIAIQPAVGCYNSWANLRCLGCYPLGEKLLWNRSIHLRAFPLDNAGNMNHSDAFDNNQNIFILCIMFGCFWYTKTSQCQHGGCRCSGAKQAPGHQHPSGWLYYDNSIAWIIAHNNKITWGRCSCLVTCLVTYLLTAKPGNKTAKLSWTDPYHITTINKQWSRNVGGWWPIGSFVIGGFIFSWWLCFMGNGGLFYKWPSCWTSFFTKYM